MNKNELIPDSTRYDDALKRLQRAVSNGIGIESFNRALDEMLVVAPSEEALPGSWKDSVITKILWEEQTPALLEKLNGVLDHGPSIKGNEEYIATSITLQNVDVIPSLFRAGAIAKMDKSQMLYAYELLLRGVWPHLDLIAPDFFVKAINFSSVCSGISRSIFNEEYYENGRGMLSEEFTKEILRLPFKEELSVFYKKVFEQAWYYNSGSEPWKKGLALLIEEDVFSFQELRRILKAEFSPLLRELQTELEFRKLERDTGNITPNRLQKGLRL